MDIHTIDLHFQDIAQTIASYLLLGQHRPVLVETGPATTRAALVNGLRQHGLTPADVGHVFLTHIHLDHAGDAGWWAQQGAQVYVHPVGAPHLIDPSRLVSSATRIYGADMDRLWGEITPAPAANVTTLEDGQIITLGDLVIQALDTPGHASHHFVYRIGDIAFTGDAAGIRIPATPIVDLPAPPPEFDRERWLQTLALIHGLRLRAIYPTHFGLVDDVDDQLAQTEALIIAASDRIHALMEQGLARDEIVSAYYDWVKARFAVHGLPADIFHKHDVVNPYYMSVDGILRYWRKRAPST